MNVVTGAVYRHKKGDTYTVLGIAEDSETWDELVVYRRDKDNKMFVRPKSMFADGRFVMELWDKKSMNRQQILECAISFDINAWLHRKGEDVHKYLEFVDRVSDIIEVVKGSLFRANKMFVEHGKSEIDLSETVYLVEKE